MRDAILSRLSTRTFEDKNLSINQIKEIKELLKTYQSVKGPFGNSFELTFNLNNKKETNGKKIGTYGLLKNVPAYVGGVCQNAPQSIVDFGYVFEHVILELTKIDLGTCWLGGTFKRKDYRRELEENEIIPAISPVGIKAEKRSLIDRTIRSRAQSSSRLDDALLFFDYQSQLPLGENADIVVKQSLCLVRRAPSASNKQPWRCYVDGKKVHFYIERTKGYAKPLNYDIQLLDLGIALAHYDIGVRYFKKIPTFSKLETKELEGKEYIITVEF
jgi:hypothetical protein